MIEGVAIRDEKGRVFSLPEPFRHHNVIRVMCTICGFKTAGGGGHTQGFVTDEGRFVDRLEAYELAFTCGQFELEDALHGAELFSEDLW